MFLNHLNRNKKIWEEAYIATAQFYKRDGEILGVYALTEDTNTILPCQPYAEIEGEVLKNWELLLVSLNDTMPIGSVDYYAALRVLNQYSCIEKNGKLLVKGINKQEMQNLYNKCLLL